MSLVIRELSKSYGGTPVISGLSCTLPQGSRWGILGPSGIGKTTLLRLILGLEQPDGGSIAGAPEKMAALFQENRLLEGHSALANLRLAVPQAGKQGPALLAELGLEEESMAKAVSDLSGGQARRVALARALLAESYLLALDEPFTGLDDAARAQAAEAILRHLGGRTLLLVTHRQEDLPLLGIRQCIPLSPASE